jgi:uncharacterized protein (TIGR02145 family)
MKNFLAITVLFLLFAGTVANAQRKMRIYKDDAIQQRILVTDIDSLTFVEDYTVTATLLSSGGSISPIGTVFYDAGTSPVYTITTSTDNAIEKVLIDGEEHPEVAATGTYTFDNISDNHTIAVSFNKVGVEINGITWATRNVDKPGTFAENPESAGMFYQWNRKVGWSATDPMENSDGGTEWDGTTPEGEEWEPANDPCPSGWRVPTHDEQVSLRNSGSSGTTQNGVYGRIFGTEPNTVFLPAAGYRFNYGPLDYVGREAVYWSRTKSNSNNAFCLYSGSIMTVVRGAGFSVRCVAENTISVSANPAEGGTATQSGSGIYAYGTSCTVTATANSGYTFANWTENGSVVSTDASYQLTVTANRTLVANFGVEINGVIWATRNVDMPGTFAENPEDAGMFYQWNRKVGWSATDPLTSSDESSWGSSLPSGTEWETANDPCPVGWRVPTTTEQRSLLDAGNSWTTQNGVDGRIFGSGTNTVFLPAAGYRFHDGTLHNAGAYGYQWSCTQYSSLDTYSLDFYSGSANWSYSDRSFGFSVRCVAEE